MSKGFTVEKICDAFVYEDTTDDCWKAVVNDMDLDADYESPGEAYDAIIRWSKQRGLTVTLPFVEVRKVTHIDA